MVELLNRTRKTACALLLAGVALLIFASGAWGAPTIGAVSEQRSTEGQEIVPLIVNGAEMTKVKAIKLPTGLAVKEISETQFEIRGTPTKAETITAEVEAENGTAQKTTATFTWVVEKPPTLEKPGDKTSTVGQAITPVLVKGTNLATLTQKNLPAGLELKRVSETEGTITGTPTTVHAQVTVTLEAKNPAGGTAMQTFKWAITEAAPTLVKPADQTSTTGTAVFLAIKGTNLRTLTPTALPAGLELRQVNETEWTITGTPTTAKAATTVTLEAKNKEEALAATVSFSWTVNAPPVTIKKETETPAKPVETPKTPETPKLSSAGRLGTVPLQKQGRELFASFLCEVSSCRVTITATVTAYKTKFKIHSAATTIPQGKKLRIPLKLNKKQRSVIAAALKKHKKVTAALNASIVSTIGLQITKALVVTVKR